MEYRRVGKSGLEISKFGLGTMTFGKATDKKEATKMVEFALDNGINFIDTALPYPGPGMWGESEKILGEILKGKRDRIILATKFHHGAGKGPNFVGLSRTNLMCSIEKSLKNLKTDYIDLYQCHAPDPKTPLEETLRAMDDLVRQGKVRYIGCSNFPAWLLVRSLWISNKEHLISFISNQVPYSLLYRKIEEEIVPLSLKLGVGIIVYSPTAGGVLTGKYKWGEKFPSGTRLSEMNYGRGYYTEENLKVVREFVQISEEKGCSPAQLALSWVVSQKGVTSVLLGARTLSQLKENFKASEIELSQEEIKKISNLTEKTVRKQIAMG